MDWMQPLREYLVTHPESILNDSLINGVLQDFNCPQRTREIMVNLIGCGLGSLLKESPKQVSRSSLKSIIREMEQLHGIAENYVLDGLVLWSQIYQIPLDLPEPMHERLSTQFKKLMSACADLISAVIKTINAKWLFLNIWIRRLILTNLAYQIFLLSGVFFSPNTDIQTIFPFFIVFHCIYGIFLGFIPTIAQKTICTPNFTPSPFYSVCFVLLAAILFAEAFNSWNVMMFTVGFAALFGGFSGIVLYHTEKKLLLIKKTDNIWLK